ncbi:MULTISPECIES: HvfA family oxazolone/thioamide-modified RiPP metallophore [Lysobacter]|uniref:HvfA family oxazolone/thioamide-modified RiPP metallophore n=1 Tax=Lysobacter TaxID=68 RepID=UPI001F3158B2|nr:MULTISPECIES: hypothetical protein [Lysobacter]UJB20821.1 hypothetical protein L1A79_07075 [Lysobacter capsici]UJQ30065.1 hypothetical protein L2D09_07785 [Lysobacter gummosus]
MPDCIHAATAPVSIRTDIRYTPPQQTRCTQHPQHLDAYDSPWQQCKTLTNGPGTPGRQSNGGTPALIATQESSMSKQIKKPLALALGATLIGGLSLSASAFAMSDLSQGYLLGAQQAPPAAEKAADAKAAADTAKHAEGTCGADKKAGKEGSCGADKKAGKEGSCGADKKAGKEGSCGADKKHAEGKCGEGKCGADKKAGAAKAVKTGDGAAKKAAEGKCGEGKCGGSI